MATKIIRLPEVLTRVGIKRATLYDWIAEGKFPKQIKLGPRSVGWEEQTVEDWLSNRISLSKQNEKR